MRKALAFGDLHVPYDDPIFRAIILKVIKYIKPDYVILLGDVIDFEQFSKFLKDPATSMKVDENINRLNKFFDVLSKKAPKAEFHFLEGNHEERLTKYLWKNAPAISSIAPNIRNLFKLDKREWVYHPYSVWDSCKIGDVIYHHGVSTNVNAHVSVLHQARCKFIQGHSHRALLASNDDYWSVINGHGGEVEELNFWRKRPTARQSFVIIYYPDDDRGYPILHMVEDDAAVVEGELFMGY